MFTISRAAVRSEPSPIPLGRKAKNENAEPSISSAFGFLLAVLSQAAETRQLIGKVYRKGTAAFCFSSAGSSLPPIIPENVVRPQYALS
jgi:cell division septation protein DedD